jgi:AraC-like DNA-binding protein
MSVRTLARRLGELGVSLAQIFNELRHELALSAFSHAFRRWTRTTPGEWRTKHAS